MRSKTALSQKSPRSWQIWAPDWRTLLSGVLIVVSFPPWNLWPLLWIALIPWFYAVQRTTRPKEAMIQGFWLSYFMSIGGFYWVAFVLQEFGNLPWFLSILGLQIFAVFGQPQFYVFAPVIKALEQAKLIEWKYHSLKKPLFFVFLLAFLYTGFDWILPKLFLDTLGHAFYLARHLRQVADLGGASLLTFLAFLVNYSIWHALQHRKKAHPILATALGIVALFWTYGWGRYQTIQKLISTPQKKLQAAAIQGNIGDIEKIAAERGIIGASNKVINILTQMSSQALSMTPRPQLIIWPETSYPSAFRHPRTLTDMNLDRQVENLVVQNHVPLLFGGYDQIGTKDFNAMFLLTTDSKLQTYQKNVLLMFGEYIPGADTIPFIRTAFPQVGNFGRGDGPSVLNINTQDAELGTVKVGPIICYEALFPNYVIEEARQGSQFIANITNDSWFGKWGEPQLHLALTTFRSIETRLPMLRSTNTGISTLILPDGEITQPTGIGTQEIMNVSIPLNDPIPTLMKLWGDWFGIFSLTLGVVGIAVAQKIKKA
jgi:apolipoprotein N-acyltransferase